MNFCAYVDPSNKQIDQYRALINEQAQRANVPPCALAATVEIESGGLNVFQAGMPPGTGCGVGLCQITYGVTWDEPKDPHFKGYALLTPSANLFVAATYFLRPALDCAIALRDNPQHAAWMQSVNNQLLFWAFAAYNGGDRFVQTCVANCEDPDRWTTDRYAERALAIYERNVTRSLAA